jgi:cyanate permease
VVAGWIYDALGSYTPIFAVFALLNLSAVIALIAIDARPRTGEGEP